MANTFTCRAGRVRYRSRKNEKVDFVVCFSCDPLYARTGYGLEPPSQGGGGSYRGVPGPVAGAGLPIIAVGYGVYWLIRRRRRTPEK